MIVIQVIARFNVGGTATWLSALSKTLAGMGHKSIVLTGNCQSGEQEDLRLSELEHIKVPSLGKKVSLISDLRSLFIIRSHIKRLKPDVVNTHTAKAGVLGRLAVLSLGRHRPALVHTVHGHLLNGYFSRWQVKVVKFVEFNLARFTDLVLFAGETVRDEMIANGACHSDKARVVHPGVEIKDFNRTTRESSVRSPLVIGWLGRVTKIKRPDRVIELAKSLPKYHFLIGGDGDLSAQLRAIAPKNCEFLGWADQNFFWPQVDIGILTSDNEAVAISVIEAALHGVPMVATDVGGVNEAIQNSVTGILCETSIDSLREALMRLAESQQLRNLMGAQAIKFAKSKFSLEKQAKTHLAHYQEAIEILQSKALN